MSLYPSTNTTSGTGNAPATLQTPNLQAPQGFFGTIKNTLGNYFSGIGNTVSSNVQEGADTLNKSSLTGGEGTINPLSAGLGLAKNITAAVASPITQAIGMASNATGVTGGLNDISQGFVNSPVGNYVTDKLSKLGAPVLQGTSDFLETAGNVAAIQGGIDAPETIHNIWEKAYSNTQSFFNGKLPVDTLNSRIADVTPSYSDKMVGTKVIDANGNYVPRVNESTGINGKRTVNQSASDVANGTEANNIKNYPDNGTFLNKQQAVDAAISTEAENMRSGLRAEDQSSPLDAPTEQAKLKDVVESHMPQNIQDAIANGKSLPKTAEGTYWRKVIDAANKYDGTREGKLDFKQTIDSAYADARGKLAWGSDPYNALDETNTSMRDAMTKDMVDTTKNTDVTSSLGKQTNLYRASDVLTAKAQAEADSAWGRLEQKSSTLKHLTTSIRRRGLALPIELLAAGLGIPYIISQLKKMVSPQ